MHQIWVGVVAARLTQTPKEYSHLDFPGKVQHFSKFVRRRSSFHSHCKPCFLWLLELKCRSSKKQGWVGAPTSSLASRFLRRRSWGCVTGFCPTVGLLEEPKERLRLMLPRLLRPWVLTGHSYGACCNHARSLCHFKNVNWCPGDKTPFMWRKVVPGKGVTLPSEGQRPDRLGGSPF